MKTLDFIFMEKGGKGMKSVLGHRKHFSCIILATCRPSLSNGIHVNLEFLQPS